jgi:glucose/arabinose dehydrogenase
MVVFGPDGKLYFSQGAMTNTAYVGLDAYELGWLRLLPHAHDIPGYPIELTGVNLTTPNPLDKETDTPVQTGAFAPFGQTNEPGTRIPAQVPCTAAIMRCNPDGSELELVAWGLRNAYGLGFLPDGRLIAIDQGADDRGSRPVGDVPDLLFAVEPGAWYGWPDFIDGVPITDPAWTPKRGPAPLFALANHNELPPPEKALLRFPSHAAAVKFAVAPTDSPYAGQLLIALFGDEAPMTAPAGTPQAGRALARIDPADWSLHTLIAEPFMRPIDVAYHPLTHDAYVLDFGKFEMTARGVAAEPRSGKVWKVLF